jgi:hypothetical protein
LGGNLFGISNFVPSQLFSTKVSKTLFSTDDPLQYYL